MSRRIVENSPEIGRAIRDRRLELGFTIEDAAIKAGVGMKTWCRYENGENFSAEKVARLCNTLGWKSLPNLNDAEDHNELAYLDWIFDIKDYVCPVNLNEYSPILPIAFGVGSEGLLNEIEEDLGNLSSLPKGTHLGELRYSILLNTLPQQFVPYYDYEFVYKLRSRVLYLSDYVISTNSLDRDAIYSVLDLVALCSIFRLFEYSTNFGRLTILDHGEPIYRTITESKELNDEISFDKEQENATREEYIFRDRVSAFFRAMDGNDGCGLFEDFFFQCVYSTGYFSAEDPCHFSNWDQPIETFVLDREDCCSCEKCDDCQDCPN